MEDRIFECLRELVALAKDQRTPRNIIQTLMGFGYTRNEINEAIDYWHKSGQGRVH